MTCDDITWCLNSLERIEKLEKIVYAYKDTPRMDTNVPL
jgi:hypothetical protein